MMENVQKIKIKLENIWIDLIRSIYAPYRYHLKNSFWALLWPPLSGDNLFSALKTFQSLSNSNLRHLWHSLDSDRLRVPETLWSSSYSEPLPAVPNTTAHSLHSNPSSNTDYSETSASSKGSSETSLDSIPSDLNSTPTFLRDSPSHSRDKVAPTASDIKGHVIKVIRDIKGRGWSGSVGSARWWPWPWTNVI